MAISIYQLKKKFQNLLRPFVRRLFGWGITANQVTCAALIGSIALGLFLLLFASPFGFLLIPIWMFIRMALNAIDGMLAREFGQKSALGAYLNELADVISDAFLYLPFALIYTDPILFWLVLTIIFLAMLTEFAGVLGLMVGAERFYDGPMGKSDRAAFFGIMAILLSFNALDTSWLYILFSIVIFALLITIYNRIRSGLKSLT